MCLGENSQQKLIFSEPGPFQSVQTMDSFPIFLKTNHHTTLAIAQESIYSSTPSCLFK